jgi:AraC-like DNA-binding protein
MPRKITPEAVKPRVRMANYMQVEVGRSWLNHHVADLELVLVVSGAFSAGDTEHEETELTAGDVLLIRPGHPCDLICLSGKPAAFSCIHFELMPGASWAAGDYRSDPPEPWLVRTGSDFSIIELFRRCAAEFQTYGFYQHALLSTIVHEIWLRLMRHHQLAGTRPAHTARMRQMQAFLRANLGKSVSRRDLSREFGLTPEHINYLFRKQLGLSPSQFVMRERVRAAAELLRQGRLSISEVAYEVGFQDPLYFSRVFKRLMGVSPSRYE